MSPNPIKNYFQTSFDKVLSQLELTNPKELKFCIFSTSKIEKYTTFDDIYRIWVTPSFTGIRITYDEVIQNLVKINQNTIPLWIKIQKNNNTPVIIEVSQRYRKKKQIAERWPNNEIAPFEITENIGYKYQWIVERKEAIRILFFKRTLDKRLKKIIGNSINYSDIKTMFLLHFEKYRFYPALYDHYQIEDERFSKLIIEKNFKSNQFTVFTNSLKKKEVYKNLDFNSVIHFFVKNEFDWEFKGIKIVDDCT